MTMREKIQRELEVLASNGSETLSNRAFAPRGGQGYINPAQVSGAQIAYAEFKTRSLNLIRRSFGVDDDHYKQLLGLGEEFANYPVCLGIVQAAVYAFNADLLFDMKSVIAAELLGDFIDQAESLFAAGYYIPAASLAGAILEDTLRRLWAVRGWELPAKTSIDRLNIELARDDEYSLLTQKEITAKADIRNSADHGRYDDFEKADVEDMIQWVRRFAAEHLQ